MSLMSWLSKLAFLLFIDHRKCAALTRNATRNSTSFMAIVATSRAATVHDVLHPVNGEWRCRSTILAGQNCAWLGESNRAAYRGKVNRSHPKPRCHFHALKIERGRICSVDRERGLRSNNLLLKWVVKACQPIRKLDLLTKLLYILVLRDTMQEVCSPGHVHRRDTLVWTTAVNFVVAVSYIYLCGQIQLI